MSQSSTPFSPVAHQSSTTSAPEIDDDIEHITTQDETEDTVTEDDEVIEEFIGTPTIPLLCQSMQYNCFDPAGLESW